MTRSKPLNMTSDYWRAEIERITAEHKALVKKLRELKAKERARFAEALMAVCDEIEKEYTVVCMLKERAQARIDDEDAKHREVVLKAAETRRRKAQDLRDAYAYDAWLEIAMDQESYDDDELVDDQSISNLEPSQPES